MGSPTDSLSHFFLYLACTRVYNLQKSSFLRVNVEGMEVRLSGVCVCVCVCEFLFRPTLLSPSLFQSPGAMILEESQGYFC